MEDVHHPVQALRNWSGRLCRACIPRPLSDHVLPPIRRVFVCGGPVWPWSVRKTLHWTLEGVPMDQTVQLSFKELDVVNHGPAQYRAGEYIPFGGI